MEIKNPHLYYNRTRFLFYYMTITLKAVDGIIFVLDSQESAFERNLTSWNELLAYYEKSIKDILIRFAFNKQNLPHKFEFKRFLKEIEYHSYKNIEWGNTIAISGEGTLDCFEDILTRIINKY